MNLEKLSGLDASDILTRTSFDEVPEGYRDEVYVEKNEGIVVDNWFVGSEGAVSHSGATLTVEEWNERNKEENKMLVCLTCGSKKELTEDDIANTRAHDGIVFRASCEKCYIPPKK